MVLVVRDRKRGGMGEGCLRITVGTERENAELVEALKGYEGEVDG